MRIDRKELLMRHNPTLRAVNTDSPLTVGNGDFAFTADVTGLQTLYKEYEEKLPLCTMSTWGWHTLPAPNEQGEYTLKDLVMTEYDYEGRTVGYPKEKFEGNEEVYDWLRKNPHRLNLAKIGFMYENKEINESQISDINQVLDLYSGAIKSNFKLDGNQCSVLTLTAKTSDTLAIQVESEKLASGELTLCIDFPYGSSEKSASDWENTNRHATRVETVDERTFHVYRELDNDKYEMIFHAGCPVNIQVDQHRIYIKCESKVLRATFDFARKCTGIHIYDQAKADCVNGWKNFWENGAAVQLNKSKDDRALELERRIVLSQYLMAVNSSGSTPPQETGLTCNSWYGKMHLEMYLWHCAWLPLWNHTEELLKSLDWYLAHIEEARENARRNEFKGARWPKMIANEGVDCPSAVAPLLIWQQPHIIFMLELAYKNLEKNDGQKKLEFLNKYWPLITETAEFMEDFAVYNESEDIYELLPPLIPVQECHSERISKNPAFELEYWRVTLRLANVWAKRLGKDKNPQWDEIADKMAKPMAKNGVYLAHDNCPDTFEKFNKDHPSMLGAYGMLNSDCIDRDVMKNTLDKVIDVWRYETLWGWDFAVMAMSATRLYEPEKAVDILLCDTFKNKYVVSGNNKQEGRADLPLYLPGNGSILLAIPLMIKGWKGCMVDAPGFPDDGNWVVESDGLMEYFD